MTVKKITASFAAGVLTGALLFGGAAAYAAGVTAERSTNRVLVDGREVQIEAYNIAGSNYCKLRDVGRAVGFNVTWDQASGTVRIDTGSEYSEDMSNPGLQAVVLPTDGSKYVPKVGDLIPCDDGTLYEVRDTLRWENNCFAPGPLPALPTPSYDWSVFPSLDLPAVECRHFQSEYGDNLYVRNLHETLRMAYTIYEAIGNEPEAWRDGKPLTKVSLTVPAEYEPYTMCFWPWRAEELLKHVRAAPRFHFHVEAWDYYHNNAFLQTQYYIFID